MPQPPVVEIDLADFRTDPYPTLAMLRRQAPVAFVPSLNAIVISKRSDIVVSEKNTAVFSSSQPDGLMNLLMGHNMMRKDGADHTRERKALLPGFVPDVVRNVWKPLFLADVEALLDQYTDGQEIDLFSEFAMPVSADALRRVTGLTQCTPQDLDSWSQAMIDGISNYHGDPATLARCQQATTAIDAAVENALRQQSGASEKTDPDSNDLSMLALMLDAGLVQDSVRANIKLAISGGQNEPRDAIAGTVWALLTRPQQLKLIRDGKAGWAQAFEEYCRWVSPIGMSPRRIAKSHSINGYELIPEDKVFFMFSSANRDEDWFDDPDSFDILRDTAKAIAFGAGPHFCIAAAVSRCLACEVALPLLFERFPGLRLADSAIIEIAGWAFRGVLNLPVVLQR